MQKVLLIATAVLFAGCHQAPHSDISLFLEHEQRLASHHAPELKPPHRGNWHSERYSMAKDSAMIYDGYPEEYTHMAFPHGDNVHYVSRPVDFYQFLWDPKLQRVIDRRLMKMADGNSANWRYRGVRYRFTAESGLFYSPHNNKPCRHGVIYRENFGRTQAWDRIPSTFCKVGPNGEWLPLV